jgi:hypothetical protein
VAARLRAAAQELRSVADTALHADGVQWSSLAAERFRLRLAAEAAALRRTAVRLEEAADAFARIGIGAPLPPGVPW